LGVIDQELFFRLTDLILNNDVEGGMKLAEHIYTEGFDFNEFLIGLEEHFRNFMIITSTNSLELLDVSEEHAKRYQEQVGKFSIEDLLRLVKIAADTENLIRRSSNARLQFEVAMVKMIKMSTSIQLSQLIEQIESVKKNVNFPPVAAPKSRTDTPSPTANISGADKPASIPTPAKPSLSNNAELRLEDLESQWIAITEAVKLKKIALGSFLGEGWPTKLEGQRLEITFATNNGFHMESIENNKEMLQDIVKQITGSPVRIFCVKDERGILDQIRKVPARTDKKTDFETLVEKDEVVRKIVDTFDAEFIK
jgi:DNA polymerase-3 subunit gamma/tau